MRKFIKISVTGLMVLSIGATATGCLGTPPEPVKPPEPVEGAVNTMDDAYDWRDENKDASTRPTIDGGYYDPQLPQIVERVPATITLSLPDGFTVSEDYNKDVMTYTNLVLPTAEQVTNGTDFGDYLGWFNAATGEALREDSETVITGDMTIAPYWEHKDGYNYHKVGAANASGYTSQAVPGDFYDFSSANNRKDTVCRASFSYSGIKWSDTEKKPVGNAAVVHGGNNASYLGSVVSDTQPVTAGSALRFDSPYGSRISNNTVLEFYYTVFNYGTENLKLSIYQISSSTEYGNGSTTYYKYETEPRYRVDINLTPGTGTNAVAQYLLNANDNAVTYIVFEEDVKSFSFGISVGSKIVEGATDVADEYKDQAARSNTVQIEYNPAENDGITVLPSYLTQLAGRFMEAPTDADLTNTKPVSGWKLVFGENDYGVPSEVILPATRTGWQQFRLPSSVKATLERIPAEKLTVTYVADNGIGVPSNAKTEYFTNETLELPAASGTGTDGLLHAGWYDVSTGIAVDENTTVTQDMTLKPCFKYSDTRLSPFVVYGSGSSTNPNTNIDMCAGGVSANSFNVTNNYIIGNTVGYKIDYGSMTSEAKFRIKHGYQGLTGAAHEYKITVKNEGSSEVQFKLWQVNSGTDWATPTESSGVDNYGQNTVITVGAGDSVTLTLKYSFKNDGKNTMLYFQMQNAVTNLSLGIAMYVVS